MTKHAKHLVNVNGEVGGHISDFKLYYKCARPGQQLWYKIVNSNQVELLPSTITKTGQNVWRAMGTQKMGGRNR